MQLLMATSTPPEHSPSLTGEGLPWMTWSEKTRELLECLDRKLTEEDLPLLAPMPGRQDWGASYWVPVEQMRDRELFDNVLPLAEAFFHFDPPQKGLVLLCRLRDACSARAIRYLFAALPYAIKEVHGSATAHNAPIQPAEPLGSAFLLHADLFAPCMLMSIFDAVPKDHTGQSVFLSTSALSDLTDDLEIMPKSVRGRIASLLTLRGEEDGFDELMDLLHNPDHAWTNELERRLRAEQLRIKLQTGQGYVLDDRKWLHGREPQSCRVEVTRLDRLVFDTRYTMQPRLSTRRSMPIKT